MLELATGVRDLEQLARRVRLVAPAATPPERVRVGASVRIASLDDQREATWFLSGFDDGDPATGRLSYASPPPRRRHQPPGLATGPHALARPAAFDRRVIAGELARDASWGARPRVVETWHPRNLADAAHRNPAVARELSGAIVAALAHRDVIAQPVTASPRTLAARCREPGPPTLRVRFFLAVAETAVAVSRSWGFTVLAPIATDRVDLHDAIDRVISALVESGQSGRRAVA